MCPTRSHAFKVSLRNFFALTVTVITWDSCTNDIASGWECKREVALLRGQRIGGFEHSPCTCDDDGDYVDDEDEDYDDGFEPSSCAVTPVHRHRWHPLHGKSHRWRFSLAASSNVENYPIFNSHPWCCSFVSSFFCFLFCRFFVSPLPLSHLCPALWLIVYTFCLWWHRRCSSSLKGVSPSPIFALSHRGVSPYYLSTKRYTGCFFKLFLSKNEVLDP